MKIYISMDMEGIGGVAGIADIEGSNEEYQRAREWMTAEANAAIDGAVEAGATEIIISDSHSLMRNLLAEKLRENVRVIRGTPRNLSMMAGIDESFDAAMLVGYHAMAGTDPGVLSHTFLLSILSLSLNGILVGETGFNAAIAGHYGVPIAFVSGDDALEREVKVLLPWTECVVTKKALSWTSAESLTPKKSQKKIKAGVIKALGEINQKKPFVLANSIECEIEFDLVVKASIASHIPGVERITNRKVQFTGNNMLDVSKIFKAVANSISGENYI